MASIPTGPVARAASRLGSSLEATPGIVGKSFTKLWDSLVGGGSRAGGVFMHPFAWAVEGVRIPVRMVNLAFRGAPRITAGATVLGGGVVVAGAIRNHEIQQEKQAGLAALAQAQGPYKNVTTPDDFAAMQTALQERAQAGHAGAIEAGRTANETAGAGKP